MSNDNNNEITIVLPGDDSQINRIKVEENETINNWERFESHACFQQEH